MAAMLLVVPAVQAHPESISTIELQIQSDGAKVTLTLQTRDLSNWFPPGNHPDYMAFVIDGLKDQAASLFEFQADDQAVAPTAMKVYSDKPGCVKVDLFFKFPATTQLLLIRAKSLVNLPSGHQQLLCAEDARGTVKGDDSRIVLEQPLTSDQDFAEIQMPDARSHAAETQPSK